MTTGITTRTKFNIDFVSKFPVAVGISVLLVGAALALVLGKGLNYGVDFKGGSEVQVRFTEVTKLSEIRSLLSTKGFGSSTVQAIGEPGDNEFLIKVAATEADVNKVTDGITALIESDLSSKGAEIRKTDIVGPKAGAQLRVSGFQAMFWAIIGIMIYIALRFDYKYAPGAIVALFHDVVIILGIFALTGREFGLQIVGALLAIIGYSVNDTVVVYDRVREHEGRGSILRKALNGAINETLSRTILTSTTTLIVSLCMYTLGGGVIHDFFFAITLGVVIGTYSSIFVAAPTTILFDKLQSRS